MLGDASEKIFVCCPA